LNSRLKLRRELTYNLVALHLCERRKENRHRRAKLSTELKQQLNDIIFLLVVGRSHSHRQIRSIGLTVCMCSSNKEHRRQMACRNYLSLFAQVQKNKITHSRRRDKRTDTETDREYTVTGIGLHRCLLLLLHQCFVLLLLCRLIKYAMCNMLFFRYQNQDRWNLLLLWLGSVAIVAACYMSCTWQKESVPQRTGLSSWLTVIFHKGV